MATAHPLYDAPLEPADDLEVFPLDDLSVLPPEVRAAVEAAEARIANGTAHIVPHSEIQRIVEEQRRRHGG